MVARLSCLNLPIFVQETGAVLYPWYDINLVVFQNNYDTDDSSSYDITEKVLKHSSLLNFFACIEGYLY